MMLRRCNVLATLMLLTALTAVGLAQGPLQKQVNYDINVPYALRMGKYVLPPGKYVLYQINANNPNLFALYRGDRMRPPIAMIHTVRIDYASRGYPEKTKIFLDIDEERDRRSLPEVQGWTIPGMDGWEIISVVESKKGMLARYDDYRKANGYRTVAKANQKRRS